jgi:HK97 family phage major capsid protein
MSQNINALKAERAQHKEAASKLVNAAIDSGKDLAGDNLKQYQKLVAEIDRVQTAIDDYAAGASFSGVTPFGLQAGHAPQMTPAGGLKTRMQNAYVHANADMREQIDSFRAFLSGDIQASANLKPSGDGAVVIPSFVFQGIERNYTDFSPVESVARIWATDTGADITYPVLSDTESAVQLDAAALTGADATVSGDTPPTALTGPTLRAWKVSSKPVFVPRETATDSSIDIVGEIILSLYARIARFENLKFTKGVGTTEAEGFLTNATKLVTGAVALDLDICLDLAYNVPTLYRSGGVYMMSDTTAKYLRKLKTGLSGDKRQLWADADATKGTPATLHGYPVVINNDMDSVDTDGTFAAVNPVAFGNFSKFVVRKAEQGQTFIRRYEVPAKDGAAAILFRRSDSKLIVPTAISKVAVS